MKKSLKTPDKNRKLEGEIRFTEAQRRMLMAVFASLVMAGHRLRSQPSWNELFASLEINIKQIELIIAGCTEEELEELSKVELQAELNRIKGFVS